MKCLHLANHCHEIGNGIMNVAVDLACEQARKGHQVAFASAGGSYAPLLEAHGVDHHDIAQHWREPIAAAVGLFRLHRLISQTSPDIVHAHMMAGAAMARALRGLGDFALVTTVHNEWQRTARVMALGDLVICVSAGVCERMAERGVEPAKLRIVRNGPLGSPRRQAPKAAPRPLGRPAIVTVCGLYRRKGIADLIAAFELLAARHPNARLYIVGDGPDRKEFVSTAARTACADRIEFTGFVADPRPLFAQADIFVLASHNEPFGLVLAEAREAGCAIVGTCVGGIPEVLENGARGLLTPARDPQALAGAIDVLLSDAARRSEFRARARANLGWLTCSRAADETLDIYAQARALRAARPRFAQRLSGHDLRRGI